MKAARVEGVIRECASVRECKGVVMQNASEEVEAVSLQSLPSELVAMVAERLVSRWMEAAAAYYEDPEPSTMIPVSGASVTYTRHHSSLFKKEREAAKTVQGMLAFRQSCRLGYDVVKPWTASSTYKSLGMNEGMDPRYARFAFGYLMLWKRTRPEELSMEQHAHLLAACMEAMMAGYKWVEMKAEPFWEVPNLNARAPGRVLASYMDKEDSTTYWVKLELVRDGTEEKTKWRKVAMEAIDKLMQERAETWRDDRIAEDWEERGAALRQHARRERSRKVAELLEYADRHNIDVTEGRVRSLRAHYMLRLRELQDADENPQRLAYIAARGWEEATAEKRAVSVASVGVNTV